MQNAIKDHGIKYTDAGYSVVPIYPHTKRPGYSINAEPQAFGKWQKYCDTPPNPNEIMTWGQQGAACGIGIALGYNNVVAIDIDLTDGPVYDILIDLLPDSDYRKIGQKGFTAFYRTEQPMKAQKFKLRFEGEEVLTKPYYDEDGNQHEGDLMAVLEILSHGNQTVIPPTIHPGTHREYEWEGDPLSMCPAQHLPLLPSDFPDQVRAALLPLGFVANRDTHKAGSFGHNVQDHSTIAMICRMANDAALRRPETWVPLLERVDIDPKHSGQNGTWRIMATWRGGDGYNISIHPEGITDFTTKDGNANGGMTAIDLVVLMHDVPPLDAALWLDDLADAEANAAVKGMIDNMEKEGEIKREKEQNRYEAAVRDMAINEAKEIELEAQRQLDEYDKKQIEEGVKAEVNPYVVGGGQLQPLEDIITGATGLVGDITRLVYAGQDRDCMITAFASAVSLVSFLSGRRWAGVRSEGKFTHPNVYIMMSVDSGVGKTGSFSEVRSIYAEALEIALSGSVREGMIESFVAEASPEDDPDEVIKEATARVAKLTNSLLTAFGAGKAHSQGGMVNFLLKNPNGMMFWDEVGAEMKRMLGIKADSAASAQAAMMKELTTAAGGSYRPTMYADPNRESPVIQNPCLTLLMAGTPKQGLESFPPSAFEDGFTGRILFLEDSRYFNRKEVEYLGSLRRTIVQRCVDMLRSRFESGDMNFGGMTGPDMAPTVIGVHRTEVASEWLRKMEAVIEEESIKAHSVGRPDRPLWTRASEMAQRISVIHALGKGVENPVIDEQDMLFGIKLAMHSTKRAANAAMEASSYEIREVAENDEIWDKILQLVRARGKGKYITTNELNRKTKLGANKVRDAVNDLQINGQVAVVPTTRSDSFKVFAIPEGDDESRTNTEMGINLDS